MTRDEAEQALLAREAQRRVRQALQQIEAAQNQIGSACATLSSLRHAAPQWKATSKLYDTVHAHWYKVRDALEGNTKVELDPENTTLYLQRLETLGDGRT